jgi:hypothetical protein
MSELSRLCRALAKALSHQSDQLEDRAADSTSQGAIHLLSSSVMLCGLAVAFGDAANALDADEMARLGVIGPQPKDLTGDHLG